MNFEEYAKSYLANISRLIALIPLRELEIVVKIIKNAYQTKKKIILMGNGGSASTAAHVTCDLSKGTIKQGKSRLKVISLSDNIPLITAWANDTSFENIFSEQLLNIIEAEDVVIAFSGSGNSLNILKAIDIANKAGAITIGFSGYKGGKLASYAKYNVIVNSENMQNIEDIHLILGHIIFSFLNENIII
ncbi:MAG: SIS domain-containing protein [bacterium]